MRVVNYPLGPLISCRFDPSKYGYCLRSTQIQIGVVSSAPVFECGEQDPNPYRRYGTFASVYSNIKWIRKIVGGI